MKRFSVTPMDGRNRRKREVEDNLDFERSKYYNDYDRSCNICAGAGACGDYCVIVWESEPCDKMETRDGSAKLSSKPPA